MLAMNEVLICKPGVAGMHTYQVKRRTTTATYRVDVIAHNGKTALEIAHSVFDGRCNMIQAERVAA